MEDTAQSLGTAETEPVSREDAIANAADAFKVSLGQIAPDERPRGADGKFVSTREPEEEVEEIETPEEAEEAEAGAESGEEVEGEEAAEEAQPDAPDMPTSWAKEDAELWSSLPPEAQAKIAEREGQRDRAVNLKFQEAANVLKANEAIVTEAQTNRQRYVEAVDQVLSLVVPQPPSRSMLDINSADYDPDQYHYRKAQYEDTVAFLNSHAAQRQQLAAQEQQQRFEAINSATRDAFVQAVPDAVDQAKAPAVFNELIEYAVSLGTPVDVFQTPTTAVEWLVLHKAMQYDRLQQAKAKVRETPAPKPKPQPAVRPGVTTPRSAIQHQQRTQAMDRLRSEGSIDAGAAALKQLMKGKLS